MSNQKFKQSLNKSVGKFKYNSDGVCQNPEILISHKGNVYEYDLYVAEGPVGWMAGYDITWRGTKPGCGQYKSPVSKKGMIYYSKTVASIDIANQVMEKFGIDNKHRDLSKLRAFIDHHGGENGNQLNQVAMATFETLTADQVTPADSSDDHKDDATRYVTGKAAISDDAGILDSQTFPDEIFPEGQPGFEMSVSWNLNPLAAEKTPLIKFVKKRSAKSKAERYLFAELDTNHAGDWLNDPRDMSMAKNLAEQAIKMIEGKSQFKYARQMKVEETQDPHTVQVWSLSYNPDGHDHRELLCSFIAYQEEPAAAVRYSDQELAEFEVITKAKLQTAEHELKYLQDLQPKLYATIDFPEVPWLIQRQGSFIGKLRAALCRIKDKSFGICLATGKLIDKKKLTQFPTATTVSLNNAYADRSKIQLTISAAEAEKANAVNFLKENSDTNISSSKPTNNMALQKAATGSAFNQDTVLAISCIIPSPTNKIHRADWELDPAKDPEFAQLVLSVKATGIFQNLVVRPNEKPGKYYLVCGERRLTAAKLAGLKDVPVKIMSLNDDEAFEMQISENLQRKDVHPMKEGESYQAYIDQTKATIDDLVAKFSKTRDYIVQRLSFNALIPELRKDFYANKMGAGHAVLFARLTAQDQKDCFINCKVMHGPSAGSYKLIDDVKQYIQSTVMMDLAHVSWDLKDANLVKAAGSCADCPKRSGSDLFGDIKEKDRCFDKKCFLNKGETFALMSVTNILMNDPDTPLIKLQSHDIVLPGVKKLIDSHKAKVLIQYTDFKQCSGEEKGLIRALIVGGAQAGCLQNIKMIKQAPKLASSPSGEKQSPAVVSIKDKIESQKRAIEMIIEEIGVEAAGLMKKKLTDFKPYISPDPKKLTKWENVAFLMALVRECGYYKINELIKKIKPVGVKPSSPGYEVEKYAALPADLSNFIMRHYIDSFLDEDEGDDHIYLIRKLAEENTAIKIPLIEAEAKQTFKQKLDAAEEKLKKLETPPVAKAAVKPVAKKAAKK